MEITIDKVIRNLTNKKYLVTVIDHTSGMVFIANGDGITFEDEFLCLSIGPLSDICAGNMAITDSAKSTIKFTPIFCNFIMGRGEYILTEMENLTLSYPEMTANPNPLFPKTTVIIRPT